MKNEHQLLREAYTEENLTKICSQLLFLYRTKQYEGLRQLLKMIGHSEAYSLSHRQLLSKLMRLYHPDLLSKYIQILDSCDSVRISQIAHILSIQKIKELNDFEFENVESYTPDKDLHDEEIVWENEDNTRADWDMEEEDHYGGGYDDQKQSLFYIFKMTIYGREDIELPISLLEDIDEIELADRGMEQLEGVGYFHQLIRLDVSNNRLSNLDGLEELPFLEELYASSNVIGYIDSLSYLEHLRVIDLSSNHIDDISALLDLPHLEFVDLTDNPVPTGQIELLKAKDCLVII